MVLNNSSMSNMSLEPLKTCVSCHGMNITEAIIHILYSSFLLTWCSRNCSLLTSQWQDLLCKYGRDHHYIKLPLHFVLKSTCYHSWCLDFSFWKYFDLVILRVQTYAKDLLVLSSNSRKLTFLTFTIDLHKWTSITIYDFCC